MVVTFQLSRKKNEKSHLAWNSFDKFLIDPAESFTGDKANKESRGIATLDLIFLMKKLPCDRWKAHRKQYDSFRVNDNKGKLCQTLLPGALS